MAEELNDVQQEVDTAAEEVETLEETPTDEQDTTDYKAKFEEAQGRLKRAETKLEKLKVEKKAEAIVEKQKTGDLDETQLDYLDLKGISEQEDVDVIQRHVQRTGETVRQALKDDYVISKLDKNKAAREVKDATPSATKRSSGGQSNDVALAVAKFEQTGKLPDDFKLASEVVNAIEAKSNTSKPSWH